MIALAKCCLGFRVWGPIKGYRGVIIRHIYIYICMIGFRALKGLYRGNDWIYIYIYVDIVPLGG